MVLRNVGMLSLSLAALTLSCGCAARLQYRLTPEALTPPEMKSPPRVRNVAGPRWSKGACDISTGPLRLTWRGRDAVLQLGLQPSDEQLDEFRNRITALEGSNCLANDGVDRVLDAVASSLTLPSRRIFYARYGRYERSASLDLDTNFRLKVLSPLLAPGVTDLKVDATIPDQPGAIEIKMSPGLEGYETSYYELRPAPGGGVRPILISIEQTRDGQTAPAAKPAGFAPELRAGRVRLLFMRGEAGEIRDIMLLSASSHAPLEAACRRIEASGDTRAACRAEQEVFCVPVPRLSAVTPELRVWVQGKPVYITVGATLFSALSGAVAAGLRVSRPWHDKLIPVTSMTSPEELLKLVLIGGERIEW
jgi:hypothetical protein